MNNRRWWDAAAIAVAAIVAALAAFDPPLDAGEAGAWGATAAFLLLYFAYARRFVGGERTVRNQLVAVLFAVVLAAGTSFEPSFATLQTFIYPYLWVSAPSTRSAIVSNVIVASAIVVGYGFAFGPGGLIGGLAVAALSVAFSLVLGLWITRIADYGEERGRLLAELQAAQGELAAMHRDAGVASERERLAREIHDTIAQSLTGLVMLAERAEREFADGDPGRAHETVVLIESMARESLGEARSLVAAITPVHMESTLAEAIGRLAARFERETGVRVRAEVTASGLSRELEVVLLRCAQEGLANVRKHARAGTASVRVETDAGEVVLEVCDDGIGIGEDVSDAGFGLAGMRDRVSLVGGRLGIGRPPEGGTRLTVRVPIASAAPPAEATTGGAS